MSVGPETVVSQPRRWWSEPQLWLVILLTLAAYTIRLDALPLRGEESRRGQVAVEMIQRGDFIVPRQQGELFLSRPPLQNWLIALAGIARGQIDEWAIRGPSALATLCVVALIYGYSRTFLSAASAMVAGLAFASAGQVLQLGRSGETEALFTLWISLSLLGWHWAWMSQRRPIWAWMIAGLAVAAGTLTKGPQAPIYFVTAVGMYLAVRRELRAIWQPAVLAGIATVLGLVALWQVPFWKMAGTGAVWQIYASDVGLRFADMHWQTIVEHLFVFPLDVLVCLLPWSLLLVAYLSRKWRAEFSAWPPQAVFLLVCLAVTFPSCWLVPGARSRYFMPLYPCVAPLIGLVAERAWVTVTEHFGVVMWRRFFRGVAALTAAAGVGIFGLSMIRPGAVIAQPSVFACFYLVACSGMAVLLWRIPRSLVPSRMVVGATAVAAFVALSHTFVVSHAVTKRAESTGAAVAELKARLGPEVQLVSFGEAHHLFTYYFHQPIELHTWPASRDEVPSDVEYFCYQELLGVTTPELPFPWERVAVISCDRTRKTNPEVQMVIGRPLTDQTARRNAEELPAAAR